MSRKVRLSQQSSEDIEQAYLYIRQDSPERARRWRKRLLDAIHSLKTFPDRHAVLFDAATAGRDVRQMIFGAYCVLYEVEADHLYVLTVRHSARRPIVPGDLPKKE
jgi:plasmid stabilization system protein ParE